MNDVVERRGTYTLIKVVERDTLKARIEQLEAALEAMCINMKNDGHSYRDCYIRARTILAKQSQEPDLEAMLKDPNVVHINMLRGGIAKPTWAQIKHLYPEEFTDPACGDGGDRTTPRDPQP